MKSFKQFLNLIKENNEEEKPWQYYPYLFPSDPNDPHFITPDHWSVPGVPGKPAPYPPGPGYLPHGPGWYPHENPGFKPEYLGPIDVNGRKVDLYYDPVSGQYYGIDPVSGERVILDAPYHTPFFWWEPPFGPPGQEPGRPWNLEDDWWYYDEDGDGEPDWQWDPFTGTWKPYDPAGQDQDDEEYDPTKGPGDIPGLWNDVPNSTWSLWWLEWMLGIDIDGDGQIPSSWPPSIDDFFPPDYNPEHEYEMEQEYGSRGVGYRSPPQFPKGTPTPDWIPDTGGGK